MLAREVRGDSNGRNWVVRDYDQAFYWHREPNGTGGFFNVGPTMNTYHKTPPCTFEAAKVNSSGNVEEAIAFRYESDGTGWDALVWHHDATSAVFKKAIRS